MFSSYSHLSLSAASHHSLCIVHLFPLPCLVLLCARLLRFHPLLLDTWIHAFTWEPFYSSLRALSCAAYTRSCQSVGAVSESEWTGGGARSHLSYVMLHSLLPALFFSPPSPSSPHLSIMTSSPVFMSPCKPLVSLQAKRRKETGGRGGGEYKRWG